MGSTNWRPTQGASGAVVDPSMDSGDWRAQLQADSRQMDTLKRHLPFSGNEGLQELKKIAVRFEEKIYTAATSQQLIGQHNNLSSMQQQQSGQQQQLLGSQSGNSNMQTNQHSMQQMLLSSMPMQQQNHQSSATLLPTQAQQSLTQLQQQQQVMPHMQSQPGQMQQQVGMQQQPNLLQRDMQQRLPTSGVFQQQNVIDQQKQIFQQQRAMPEASSTSLDSTAQTGNSNGGDWQEEAYQKIKAMKDLYLLDLNDMHQKILGKLQQFDSLPQQPKNDQLDKLKMFKSMLERYIQLLQIPNKHNILANYKDKLGTYEKKIIQVINSHRRKPGAPQQQAQQTHFQLTQVQSHETQMNLQGSMAAMQPNNMGNLQQSMPMQQQNRQSSATLLPTQVQQSLTQLQQQQQQVMPHMQSQPGQMQQQVGMQQQPNLMQRDMQQRLPTLGVFQQQNVIDQQKQIFQQQRAMPETSSNSTAQTGNSNSGDWQEEVYQKIKAMKDLYLLDLNDMHQEILGTLQQFDSLPQQPKNDQLDKLKMFKSMLERYIQLLKIHNKHNILANYKDKLGTYEKKIIQVINSHRRKPGAPQQQAQALPQAHMQSMQQSQQTHSQLTQVQSHETQMNL